MIAIGLLSLVTAAAFSTVNVMSNQAAATTDRFTAQGEGQTIADRITKDLRTAVAPTSTTAAFASAGPNDVVFYASLTDLSLPTGTGPIRLHVYASLVPSTNVYVFHEDATVPSGSVGVVDVHRHTDRANRRPVPRHESADVQVLPRRRHRDHSADRYHH